MHNTGLPFSYEQMRRLVPLNPSLQPTGPHPASAWPVYERVDVPTGNATYLAHKRHVPAELSLGTTFPHVFTIVDTVEG
jgi:hypothetical protein